MILQLDGFGDGGDGDVNGYGDDGESNPPEEVA